MRRIRKSLGIPYANSIVNLFLPHRDSHDLQLLQTEKVRDGNSLGVIFNDESLNLLIGLPVHIGLDRERQSSLEGVRRLLGEQAERNMDVPINKWLGVHGLHTVLLPEDVSTFARIRLPFFLIRGRTTAAGTSGGRGFFLLLLPLGERTLGFLY